MKIVFLFMAVLIASLESSPVLEVEISYAMKAQPKKPVETLPVTEMVQEIVTERLTETSTLASSTLTPTTTETQAETETASNNLENTTNTAVLTDEHEVAKV